MSLEILLITFVIVGILLIWHLDRSGYYERDENADELERRIEDQSAQIAKLVRALETRPERRPRVTPSQQTAVEQAAPEPAPEPEPEQATQTELALERARRSSKRRLKFNQRTRPVLVEKARKLHAQGFSFVEIGELLDISSTSAARYVRGTHTREARAAEYERTRQQRGDGEQA